MKRFRIIILAAIAFSGLAIGALFSYHAAGDEFVTVSVKGAALIAQIARDQQAQAIGLSGRDSIGKNQAMLFLFNSPDRYGFWMKGMRFPIDIFWIRNGAIVDVEEDASLPAPGAPDASLDIYKPDVLADTVLETIAGFARDHDVKIGDAVAIGGTHAAPWVSSAWDALRSSASPAPGEEYFIQNLRARPPIGSAFTIGKVLATAGAYQKFAITYRADDLLLTGVMNVPFGPTPPGGFPVLILNHGLIYPRIYFSGRGSKREQDFFSRHGYVTIHPDYRGYSSTTPAQAGDAQMSTSAAAIGWPWYGADPAFPEHHDFYEGYTKDMLSLIDALKKVKIPFVDTGRIGMWGHSMGGGVAMRVAVRTADIGAFVLFAPISADAEDNFYELPQKEIAWLHQTYGQAGAGVYRLMSPITYFNDIGAPVQLHHGLADTDAPAAFSQKIFAALTADGKKTELFTYPGEKHEFVDAWPLAATRALQFFDKYVKNAR